MVKTITRKSIVAVLGASALLLAGCAQAGPGGDSSDSGSDPSGGFPYGAPQEAVDELITDLEPVTLTYQPAAQSPNALVAKSAEAFKAAVEERSDGKITVEIVYGQAIAGFQDITDALVDGRVDLAFVAPIYVPADFPVYNTLTTLAAGMPNSPVFGEAVTTAALLEVGWNSPELLAEYDAHGLSPLIPLFNTGNYYTLCTKPHDSLDDWAGTQVRIGNPSQMSVVEAMGATPVSMTFPEMFEGLQRGTVDCALSSIGPAFELGITPIAPFVSYTSGENSFSGNSGGALLAGSKYQSLPLPYQQIIFDAAVLEVAGNTVAASIAVLGTIEAAKEAGGSFTALDADTDALVGDVGRREIDEAVSSGTVASDVDDQARDAVKRWGATLGEYGLSDDESFEDADPDAFDAEMFFDKVYEEVVVAHRPQ